MKRELWYVFLAHDGVGLHQFLASAVQDVEHCAGGWCVIFKRNELRTFLERRHYRAPFLSGRVRM